MADSKLTALTAITSTDGDEVVYVVDDPGGTPVSRKITVDNLFAGAKSAPPHPGMSSGLYYAGEATSLSTDTAGDGSMIGAPLWVPESTTFDQAVMSVTTAAASTSYRMMIYTVTDGLPDALESDLGTVDASTTGDKTLTISVTLAKGWYWVSGAAQGGAPGIRVGYPGPFVGSNAAAGLITNFRTPYVNGVTGAAPASWGTPGGYTYWHPRILLRKA